MHTHTVSGHSPFGVAARRFAALIAGFTVLVLGAIAFPDPAGAYACDLDVPVPYLDASTDNVTAYTTADCPGDYQYKELRASVVRKVTAFPDVTVDTEVDNGVQAFYSARPSGCDAPNSNRAYKTVASFTNQGQATTTDRTLACS